MEEQLLLGSSLSSTTNDHHKFHLSRIVTVTLIDPFVGDGDDGGYYFLFIYTGLKAHLFINFSGSMFPNGRKIQ